MLRFLRLPIDLAALGVLALLCLLVALAGCSSAEIELGPEWRPLERVRESSLHAAGLGDAGARTVGETVYVSSLEVWEKRLPAGPVRDAVLAHERVHAERQLTYGLWPWITRYAFSRDFAWEEEKHGWYAQIQHLRSRGVRVDPAAVARTLADYEGPWGDLVDEGEARAWVDQALAGKWVP